MYCDYHVHTNYSDDSTYLMEDVIKDAIKMKMDEICFTDHVDYGIKKDWDEGPVEYLYGLSYDFNEHITTGGMVGFPYLISFRPGDPTTIATLQTLYGSAYRERIVLPASRYAEPVVKCDLEPMVTEAEFASLGIGDCIVKILSYPPQRVHINLNS